MLKPRPPTPRTSDWQNTRRSYLQRGETKKKKKRETESYYYSSYYWHANWQIIRNLKKTDIIGCCPHEVITKSLHAARLPKRDCITVAERRPLCCRR